VRFRFIAEHRVRWSIRDLCAMLGVSRGGFYDWLKRAPSERQRADQELTGIIRRSFNESRRTYGSPRVWQDLNDWGHSCSVHRVARLMRLAKLRGRTRPRRRPTDTGDRVQSAIAPNLLQRQFSAPRPNARWVADFTYVSTAEGWLFVAAVMDLFSRRIVGWSMSSTMSSQLVIDAMLMAVWRRGSPKELLHHSDQGSQYTSGDFRELLHAHGIICSMSRRGDCWDNSAMESFFSTLKTECTHRERFKTRDEARAAVFDYIESFYNLQRRHSTLGGYSPARFEQMAEEA
jgi:putative transposase